LRLKPGTAGDEATAVTTSTRLASLNLGEERPGWSPARLARVRAAVHAGTYHAPAELVAEALVASSLLGPTPNPDALGWAC
jgi:hypothetical protein